MKHVRGTLFVDYVRLIRRSKQVDWSSFLEPEDFVFLAVQIDDREWYPLDTFERFGLGILHAIADGSLDMVRTWGYLQVDAMLRLHPEIIEPGSPYESLMRVVVYRAGYFDFEVLTVKEVLDDAARFELQYDMCDTAELAACMQTLGAFEELVRRAGGKDVKAVFTERRWEGDPRTTLELSWL